MALDTLGGAWLYLDYERGRAYLERCVAVARESGREGRIASVYATLGAASCALHRFDDAERHLTEGIAFTDERDLDIVRVYMLGWLAVAHLHRGRWQEADATAGEIAHRPDVSDHNRVAALVALGRLYARRGDASPWQPLDIALELASRSGDFQHLGPVRAARAEAAWLAGDRDRTLAEARAAHELAVNKRHPWLAGELAFWRWRAGDAPESPDWLAEPFALQIAGDWRAAAAEWGRLGCLYERARALADGDEAARAHALAIFDDLGARPAAADLRRRSGPAARRMSRAARARPRAPTASA